MSELEIYISGRLGSRLYPAQQEVMKDTAEFFRHYDKGYISLPTGAGKTVLFSELLQATSARALILVPTIKLAQQTIAELQANGLTDVRTVSPMQPERANKRISVATYASFVRQYRKGGAGRYMIDPQKYELLILDEAHHLLAEGASEAIDEFEHAFQLGYTATPDYSEFRQLADKLPHKIHELTIREACQLNLLAPFSNLVLYTHTDMSKVPIARGDYDTTILNETLNTFDRNEAVARFYAENLREYKTIFSCGSVLHAHDLAALLTDHGIAAAAVYGEMPRRQQDAIFADLRAGKLMAITNDKLLSEGFDEPSIAVAINVSPTLSRVRQQQRSGRALRLDPAAPNKHALVIDCIDDAYRTMPVLFCDGRIAAAASSAPEETFNVTVRGLLDNLASYHQAGVEIEIDTETIERMAEQTQAYASRTAHTAPRKPERRIDRTLAELLGTLDKDQDWHEDAACLGQDTNMFYPPKGGSSMAAKFICAQCAVQDECLEFSFTGGDRERFGIWGGLSEIQRRRIPLMVARGVPHDTIRAYIQDIRARDGETAARRYARRIGLTISLAAEA